MKKRTIMLFTLLFIANTILTAQTPNWQWVTKAGGNDSDYANGIEVGNDANSYVCGIFRETATFGNYSMTSSGDFDFFVSKLGADGNWIWVKRGGSYERDMANGIAINESNDCFIIGSFHSGIWLGSNYLSSNGNSDIFVAKIDNVGNWIWAAEAGGSSEDYGAEIVLDDSNNCYVIGSIRESATFGSYTLQGFGYTDPFVAKLDPDGNWLWASNAGGNLLDYGSDIAIDCIGNCYVSGSFQGTATFGSISLTTNGNSDVFVAKLDANGNWLWAKKAGGIMPDHANAIAIDHDGNSYLTGYFEESATFGSYDLTSAGGQDIFIAKLDTQGNWLWVKKAGGIHNDYSRDIEQNDNQYYLTGGFSDTAMFGSHSLSSSGLTDIFVAKLNANGNWLWVKKAGGPSSDCGNAISLNSNGIIYTTGSYRDSAFFDSYFIDGIGIYDIFVAQLGCSTFTENEIIFNVAQLSNHPNPFNPSTTIEFSIQNTSSIDLSIYNTKGEKINTITNMTYAKGTHSVIWKGDDEFGKSVSSGIYLYKLKVNGKTEIVKKCLLIK